MTPQEAAKKYHWVKYDSNTNTVELYLDNFMLSGLRLCEAKFYLEHLLQLRPRYDKGRRKPMFFDFGEYLHYCTEIFYNHFKYYKQPPMVDEWINKCKAMWLKMKMYEYGDQTIAFPSDFKKFDAIGGWEGVAGLLIQYFAFYMDLKVRVVDTEISFGYNKEVPLGEFVTDHYDVADSMYIFGLRPLKIVCYLTGRIDLLVDNGYKVGPVDHKSTQNFDGNEHNDFNPHDGICGYILTIDSILKKYKEQGLTNLPNCTGGWIYHISCTSPSQPRDKSKKPGPRFKTTPIDKTIIQLEDYKARQLETFRRIAELLFNPHAVPQWNTIACNNIFNRVCEFKPIHEQPSNEWVHIIKDHYETNIWDTRSHKVETEEIANT